MLTNKQEAFVQGLVAGKSQREAYRAAYKAAKMKIETIDKRACELLKNGEITGRYRELLEAVRDEGAKQAVATAADVLQELTNIGFGRKEYPSYDMFGNEHSVKPTIAQRHKALEALAKYHGLLTDKLNIDGKIDTGQLDNILAQLRSDTSG